MPKNPNSKSKPVKRDEPMNGAMKFFLAGCVAELYLLIVRRFYINGNAEQQIAWYDYYLKYLIAAGAVVLAVGAVLSVLWRQDKKKRVIGWRVSGDFQRPGPVEHVHCYAFDRSSPCGHAAGHSLEPV